MESRLIELEAKLSFAEDLLETLNTTVFRQQERIDLLERQIRLLHEQMQTLRPAEDASDPRAEIPPHY
ncbi:MAG: SlyX family protein [Thiobacillaceae bacterium]|jgi:SlyX protein|nr:SlyX family protein [Thiobacillaceae bacterium]